MESKRQLLAPFVSTVTDDNIEESTTIVDAKSPVIISDTTTVKVVTCIHRVRGSNLVKGESEGKSSSMFYVVVSSTVADLIIWK